MIKKNEGKEGKGGGFEDDERRERQLTVGFFSVAESCSGKRE